MKRGGPLRRRAALRATTGLRRSAVPSRANRTAARAPKPDPVTPAIRAEVARRSRGMCEVRATRFCTGGAVHVHHRKLRRHGDHRPVNLLHVCHVCHTHIHAKVAESYDRGWLVRGSVDPGTVLVVVGPAE